MEYNTLDLFLSYTIQVNAVIRQLQEQLAKAISDDLADDEAIAERDAKIEALTETIETWNAQNAELNAKIAEAIEAAKANLPT